MFEQAVFPNNTTTVPRFGGNQLSVLDVISRHAPRNWKVNPGSDRGRYSMQCPLPDHADRQRPGYSGSFSVDADEIVYFCFGCGGKGNGYQLQKILSGDGSVAAPRQNSLPARNSTKTKKPKTQPREKLQGVTADQLAEAKGLDPDFLRSLGWQDALYGYNKTPAIKIPYPDENGGDVQVRYRVGLDDGQRFFWEKGAKPRPLGLDRLNHLKDQGMVIFVEGETDFATLTEHGYPVQEIPGATNWQASWAPYYVDIPVQYVCQEPGVGGEQFVAKISASFPYVRVIEAPPGAKDPTELAQRTGPDAFRDMFDDLLEKAYQKRVVADTVVGKKSTYHKCDKPKERGEKSSLWLEAKELFPLPTHVKPRVKGALLWSERDRRSVVVQGKCQG